eukprot:m.366947 g.366947  ORF g.366947 m.366947 type:complete len:453 (+) comp28097_c0_seq8:344-1702(+)
MDGRRRPSGRPTDHAGVRISVHGIWLERRLHPRHDDQRPSRVPPGESGPLRPPSPTSLPPIRLGTHLTSQEIRTLFRSGIYAPCSLPQSTRVGPHRSGRTPPRQLPILQDGASVVVGLFPIVPTCIRRAHSGTAHWVIATTVGLAYTIASAEDDGGRAVIPDEAVWAKNITVLIRADMPSTLGGLAFPYPHSPGLPPQDDYLRLLTRMRRLGHLVMLSTSDDERIPAAFVRHRGARLTVLYSHGNGADIESCWDVARIFSKELKVNVLAYDYVGYSTSRLEGRAPSEKGCYRSIRAAFGYLIDDLKMRKADIVLWGCSIGSGPTVNLAQLEGARTSIGGVIIESGIASVINAGWGIVRGRDETLGGAGRMIARSTLDFFVNYTKIGKIERPICIVHGTADKIVSVSNAKLNLQNVQGASKHPPLFVEGKGHNNLDIPYGEAGRHIAHFLRAL